MAAAALEAARERAELGVARRHTHRMGCPSHFEYIDRLVDAAEVRAFAADLGQLTAWMHLRGAGRYGAAGVEELMAFGRRRDWRKALLGHARAARTTTLAHYAEFAVLNPALLVPRG